MCRCVQNVDKKLKWKRDYRHLYGQFRKIGGDTAYKTVFRTCPNHVLKIGLNTGYEGGAEHVRREYEIWRDAGKDRELLAPIIEYKERSNFFWIIQRYCEPVRGRFRISHARKLFDKLGLEDTQLANCGVLDGRLVAIDYGL